MNPVTSLLESMSALALVVSRLAPPETRRQVAALQDAIAEMGPAARRIDAIVTVVAEHKRALESIRTQARDVLAIDTSTAPGLHLDAGRTRALLTVLDALLGVPR